MKNSVHLDEIKGLIWDSLIFSIVQNVIIMVKYWIVETSRIGIIELLLPSP